MNFSFDDKDINIISKTIESKPEVLENSWSWRLKNNKTRQSLVFVLHNEVELGKNNSGSLVSVQTHHGDYELHDCLGYIVFEPDELIFFNSDNEKVSCIIIGKQCTCSMYTNISRDILSADFSTLDPAVLLSAMQLSLTEDSLP